MEYFDWLIYYFIKTGEMCERRKYLGDWATYGVIMELFGEMRLIGEWDFAIKEYD